MSTALSLSPQNNPQLYIAINRQNTIMTCIFYLFILIWALVMGSADSNLSSQNNLVFMQDISDEQGSISSFDGPQIAIFHWPVIWNRF